MHAVVLVSGGAAITPFTTPDAAAASGLAAGNTMTAIRAHLLASGYTVFTAPAGIGPGPVVADTGWQGFAEPPHVLASSLTINAVGHIDDAGRSLRAFLNWLTVEHAVTSFSLVAHSMGGLFSRAAIAQAHRDGTPLPVRHLITIGTPWTGALLGDHHVGDTVLAAAHGHALTERIMLASDEFATAASEGAAEEVTARFLSGPTGWNAAQAGTLDGVAVTLIAGTAFAEFTEPRSVWPHDGLVQRDSALALDVPAEVLGARRTLEFDNVHSVFVADAVGLPWERALTWNPDVFAAIDAALA